MTKNNSKVQALYDHCNNTFSTPSTTPSPQASQSICSLLDTLGPADVGLTEELSDDDLEHGNFGLNQLDRAERRAQPITYLEVYKCHSSTMCIFCLPTSAVFPLHNHPEMTVFSKVLYGSLHVKAYDWVEPAQIQERKGPSSSPVRLAKLSADKVLTAPCEATVLYPKSGGNLHCLTAVTPCAVLDILSPPYREEPGRKYSYYHDYPYSTFSAGNRAFIGNGKEEDYAWLAAIETPDDLNICDGKYAGPAIEL
ncbi:plant cysteine oxidase 3 isoform X1 [Quercus suber]|uniref:plant cysteine oxidase 3 isoform X1 n=1 Tax=Quercus suber TaxID=58331 RepID=UPI000CE1762F|nr:plant cysteine oxidase 3-like isoform X1 [Quercus suber]POE80575.1 plant cysteine oxidase 3 [Quercus suber]